VSAAAAAAAAGVAGDDATVAPVTQCAASDR